MTKPRVFNNRIHAWNRYTETKMRQEEFAELDDLEKFFGRGPMGMDEALEFISMMGISLSTEDILAEHGADEAEDLVPDDILASLQSAESIGKLRETGHQLIGDSTYNWDYFGPMIIFIRLEDEQFPLSGIVFAQIFQRGGADVRNILAYGPMEIYPLDDEENPFMAWELQHEIETDLGRISLFSDGADTSEWLVYLDETGAIGSEVVSAEALKTILDWNAPRQDRGHQVFLDRGLDGFSVPAPRHIREYRASVRQRMESAIARRSG
jgi:hypothetical protein